MEDVTKNRIKVTASVETVRYYKDQWGIIVCSIDRVKSGKIDKNKNQVFKGVMPNPRVGQVYNIIADYVRDPKWGDQYTIVNMALAVSFDDTDEVGKKTFLLSLFTDNMVNEMYSTLDDPYKALKDKNVLLLSKVKGIRVKTATSMIAKFVENLHKAKVFVELEDYDLTNNMIDKLLRHYGSPDVVIEKVKENPYVLCTEVNGIGFTKADQIALAGEMSEHDPKRVEAFIIYYLDGIGQEGYSWVTPDHLLGGILEQLGEDIPDTVITQAISNLKKQNRLWWNDDKSKIGLMKYYTIAEKIAKELIRLRDAESDFQCDDWREKIREQELRIGYEYTDEQLNGIKEAIDNNVILIHGCAGSGKTSLVSALLSLYPDKKFVQTSLSGRAASRMSEVTGEKGYTIHRLLGYPKGKADTQKFYYHKYQQLPFNIYILDEISMVGANLFYYLLRAIPDGSKVIMLGDTGQLESIGSGNIAHDIICSDELKSFELTQIHRQAAKSAIITESIKVRQGRQIVNKDWVGEECRGELQDLDVKCFSDISNTYYEIMKRFDILQSEKDFSINKCQIIVPLKSKGDACVYKLNNAIQERYNPKKKQKEEKVFTANGMYYIREGDKVINTSNNYDTSSPIYNGNIGIVKEISDDGYMLINFYGIGLVMVEKQYWKGIELAYAITTHKSQGSQIDNVIVGLDFSAYSLLTKELVYTALTRAKKKCYLIAQTGALRYATAQEGVSKKQTHLQQCLHNIAHPKLVF